MDAASELEFDKQADATSQALWPGEVKINGLPYACALTKQPIRKRFAAGDRSGIINVAGIMVEISKDIMPNAPAIDSPVKDLADGKIYLLDELSGTAATDSSWFLTCSTDS